MANGGTLVDMNLHIGNQYNDLLILEKVQGDIKSKITASCRCLRCGNVSDYKLCEILSGKRKRCTPCNRQAVIVKQDCVLCNIAFEKRNMISSKRTNGYTCRGCYSNYLQSSCKECGTAINTTNGKHSGYCSKHWSLHRVAYLLVQSAKHRAKVGKYLFDIDLAWVKSRLKCCEVTGIPFEIRDATLPPSKGNYSNRHPYTPTIDKIDPGKGYLKSNCRIVCWWYNLSKSVYSDEFILRTVAQWINNKEQDWHTLLNIPHAQVVEAKTT